jgi:hypothetical protein
MFLVSRRFEPETSHYNRETFQVWVRLSPAQGVSASGRRVAGPRDRSDVFQRSWRVGTKRFVEGRDTDTWTMDPVKLLLEDHSYIWPM